MTVSSRRVKCLTFQLFVMCHIVLLTDTLVEADLNCYFMIKANDCDHAHVIL